MQPLIWEHRPDGLRAPALVCAFTGWNDAGDAASAALQFLGSSLGATRFARIDPEDFYDFQATRPKIKLVQGIPSEKAKQIVALIKESKKKAQASIQGDTVRVVSKDRDVLQDIMGLLRGKDLGVDLQFTNFRSN